MKAHFICTSSDTKTHREPFISARRNPTAPPYVAKEIFTADSAKPVSPPKLLAPLQPSQIFCIGLNYRRHAEESGMKAPERPVLFTKGINTVVGPGDAIEIPVKAASHEVDYECELAVVIGKPCKNATPANALSYVLGYTCANDVSARDWQLKWAEVAVMDISADEASFSLAWPTISAADSFTCGKSPLLATRGESL